jgi:uncharacterized protein YbjT (DUF2867 family)
MQRLILVTGATGHVGRQVVSQLLHTSATVRALARNPDQTSLPSGVEVVRGNLSDPDTLNASLIGVEAVFLMWPFPTAKAAPAVLDVVSKHARRIVYLSSMSVRDDLERQSDPISAFHADIEHLIEQSELEWTILRPSGFATNTLLWAPQIRADGVVRWPYGAAVRSLIHERDIAAVAVRALTEDGHVGAKYVLTGPQSLTQVEQVHIIGEVISRPLRYDEIEPVAARQQLLTSWGLPSLVARLLPANTLPRRMVDGALDSWAKMVTEPERVSPTMEEVTGVSARTFREWAIDHASDFRPRGEKQAK